MNFDLFKVAVSKQFEKMSKHQLFRSSVTKDELWDTYLASFPAGTDPILKERTEHNCNCCNQFIRAVGDVVAVIDGKLVSIWDVKVDEPGYQAVTDALSSLVHSKKIEDEFLHYERSAGKEKTFSQLVDGVHTWRHFHVNIPSKCFVKEQDIGTKLNESRNKVSLFKRSLTELTVDSMETVLEIIDQNSLYKGAEFRYQVEGILKEKNAYDKVPAANKDIYIWNRAPEVSGPITGIHGTAIGKLLQYLTEGKELEEAVKMYEGSIVGGANYKRPTALVSKKQIEEGRKKIEELGYTSALQRRYATINDIGINDILFADNSAKRAITGDVFDELASAVTVDTKSMSKVEEVTIEKFLADILPKAESLEVMLENNHASNFVSLIAPVDPTANNMFKWDNKFSWSYTGNVADSIKERVKAAGGSVEGVLCCRLAWNNTDDLDFHMQEPDFEIYFRNKGRLSSNGGMLDVDANGGSGMMAEPIENIFYTNTTKMKEGDYKLFVNQWSKREDKNYGFEVEIELNGETYNFSHEKRMPTGSNVPVAVFNYSRKNGLVLKTELVGSKKSKTFWNVPTNTFQKVNVVMMSPNYWGDGGVGNKHFFFMIDGCKNDGVVRGFYNEFFKEELNPHRKVMEMVGGKLTVAPSEDQLSGVGFSSTQRNSVLFRVKGKFTRVVKVVF